MNNIVSQKQYTIFTNYIHQLNVVSLVMDLNEAISMLEETNEPLAVVLKNIIKEQERIGRSQEKVIEALILHLMTPPGKVSTIDLHFLLSILKGN